MYVCMYVGMARPFIALRAEWGLKQVPSCLSSHRHNHSYRVTVQFMHTVVVVLVSTRIRYRHTARNICFRVSRYENFVSVLSLRRIAPPAVPMPHSYWNRPAKLAWRTLNVDLTNRVSISLFLGDPRCGMVTQRMLIYTNSLDFNNMKRRCHYIP